MKEEGLQEEEVMLLLEGLRQMDHGYDRLLSTMCTVPHRIAIKAHDLFIETNLGDPGLFPGTAEIERRTIAMIGEMLGCPEATGYVSTGGTESNIQAVRAARNASGIMDGNIVVPESAHFSFDKIGDLLGLQVRKAPLDSLLKVDTAAADSLCDSKTVAIVGIAGTTEYGQVDPIEELSKIAIERGVHLHVDAAFGGFALPFLPFAPPWDFMVKGVSSITIDPHKMGMSTIPAGGLLFRDGEDLNSLEADTHYLTVKRQASLTGTRSGAAAAATYAVMMHLGRSGFTKIVGYCMDLTRRMARGAREIGCDPVIEPVMNVICLKAANPAEVRERLMKAGWHVSMTREPKSLRLILMPHFSPENVDLFLEDLKATIQN